MDEQKVLQVGNSAAVLLTRALRQKLGLHIGDTVIVEKQRGKIIISPKKKKKYIHGLTPEFTKQVDEFMQEHKDVLEELAKR